MRTKHTVLVTITALCLLAAPVRGAELVSYLLDAGVSLENWGISSQNGQIGKTELTTARLVRRYADRALELRYDFSAGPGYIGFAYGGAAVLGQLQRVTFWFSSDASGRPLVLRLRDGQGEHFQQQVATLDWEGWRMLDVPINACQGWFHYGGDDDGTVTWPLAVQEIILDHAEAKSTGVVRLQGLTADTLIEPADAITIRLVPAGGEPVAWAGKMLGLVAEVANIGGTPCRGVLESSLLDWQGEPLLEHRALVVVGPRATRRLSVPQGPERFGITRATATFTGDGITKAAEARIAVMTKPQRSRPEPDSPFGMGIYFGNRYTPEERIRAAQMAQWAGMKWSREEFSWNYIEPEKGRWRWDRYDDAVRVAAEHDIMLFGLLDYWGAWTQPYTAQGIADYCNYVRAVVGRYKDRIAYWEIWNEPNIQPFWHGTPEQYADLLKAAYKACKEADPDCLVIGACTSGSDLRFIERLFELGCHGCMDLLSTHPYRYPSTPEESDFVGELRRTHELLVKHGGDKPLWLTEIGYPTHEGQPNSSTEEKQAAMIVRVYLLAIASGYADKVFWYDYRNDGDDRGYNEHNFGVLHRDFAPKPAYIAYKTMTEQVGLTPKAKPWPDEAEGPLPAGVYAYQFTTGRRSTVAIWSTPDERDVALKGAPGATITVTDLMGNRQTLRSGEAVTLGEAPVFVRAAKGRLRLAEAVRAGT